MQISARRKFIQSQRQAERDMTALLRQLDERIAGAIALAGGRTGNIPLTAHDQLSNNVKAIVRDVFVTRRTLSGVARQQELARLQSLIDTARKAYKKAPQTQQARVAGRITMLTQRYQLLASQGVALMAFDEQGNPLTPFARVLAGHATSSVKSGLQAIADAVYPSLDPLEIQKLQSMRTGDNAQQLRDQSLLNWQDPRGYTLADRIWATSEDAQARVDMTIASALVAGAVAAKVIASVHKSLLGRTVTNALFATKRLLRAEITRIFGVTMREGAKSSPVEVRAYWELSPSHDPQNCDGTCDEFAAQSKANDGFSVDDVPIPGEDTHNNCQCSIRLVTKQRKQSLANMLTALAVDVMTRWLIRGNN